MALIFAMIISSGFEPEIICRVDLISILWGGDIKNVAHWSTDDRTQADSKNDLPHGKRAGSHGTNGFFFPVMSYFTREEKDSMLQEGFAFDQNLIHEKYKEVVQLAEDLK